MAGQPKRRQMLAELLRRANVEFGEDRPASDEVAIIAYIERRVSSGTTLHGLARELTDTLGVEIFREAISKWLMEAQERAGPEWQGTIARARTRGAHALTEEALQIVDSASTESREELQKAKMRADTRIAVAERWNPAELGRQTQQNVAISLQVLHLDALRARSISGASVAPALLSGEEVVIDAEVEAT